MLYNVILVITDRLIKYRYFILYKESSITEKLVYMFLRVLAANYRISEKIISDRDKLFMLKFWKLLMNQLEVHYKLLTTYHLQTDRQTERLNQTIKQYLCCYINY